MKRLVSLIVLAVVALGAVLYSSASGASLVVGPGGYPTIQGAVNAAQAGDTVAIKAGTYNEMVVPKSNLTITAYGDGEVVIDRKCAASTAFDIGAVSNVVISQLTVRNTTDASVFIHDGASSISIARNKLELWDCKYAGQDPSDYGQYRGGVASWYGGANIVITNNIIQSKPSGTHAQLVGSADGIWFKSNDNNPSGGGHYIAGNTIIGGWDGIGGEEEGSAHGTFDKDTIVENNTIRDSWDDCIQVEGGGASVRVRNNDLSGCGTGIAFAAPLSGPLYIENNTIHDLVTGLYDNHVCFKVGTNGTSNAVTYLTGNSCDVRGGSEANGIHQSGGDNMTPIVARGNRWHIEGYLYYIGDSRGQDYDGSCIEKVYAVTDNITKWQGVYDSTLAAFTARTGQERNAGCGTVPTPIPSTIPTPTAVPTQTATRTPTATATASPTAIPPTATRTPTPVPTVVLPRCQVRIRVWVSGRWVEQWKEKVDRSFCASQ